MRILVAACLIAMISLAACSTEAVDVPPDAALVLPIATGRVAATRFYEVRCEQLAVCAALVAETELFRAHVAACVEGAAGAACAHAGDCDLPYTGLGYDTCVADLAAITGAVVAQNDYAGCALEQYPASCAGLFATH
jgi:hypothetical protein